MMLAAALITAGFGVLAGSAAANAMRASAGGPPGYVEPISSTTTLLVSPNPAVTNQKVMLTAVISSSTSLESPSGSVTFYNANNAVNACANEPVSTQNQTTTVSCQAQFAAAGSPVKLRAVFVPSSGSGMSGSSDSASLAVTKAKSSVTLTASKSQVIVGGKVTFKATPHSAGSAASPSGFVQFRDKGKKIRQCVRQLVKKGTASCTVTYRATGSNPITAVYGGDGNFLASRPSRSRSVHVMARGTITSTMQWTFAFSPTYTKVLALSVSSVPAGATVVVTCRGTGCPFSKQSTPVTKQGSKSIGLGAPFHGRRLAVGTAVNVQIIRPGYIGKYYLFTMRARKGPNIGISCLAPGHRVPGQGC
jgi:hypothetical protein